MSTLIDNLTVSDPAAVGRKLRCHCPTGRTTAMRPLTQSHTVACGRAPPSLSIRHVVPRRRLLFRALHVLSGCGVQLQEQRLLPLAGSSTRTHAPASDRVMHVSCSGVSGRAATSLLRGSLAAVTGSRRLPAAGISSGSSSSTTRTAAAAGDRAMASSSGAAEQGARHNRLINEQSPYLLQHAHNPVRVVRRGSAVRLPALLAASTWHARRSRASGGSLR